jgi:energy-coupling factor transporter ATP-binding protein EcfA2
MNAQMTPTASGVNATPSERLRGALELPDGARFYRCALQINPFEYLVRHKKPTGYASEDAYNDAIVAACHAQGIEVIAVTDHYRVKDSARLIARARAAGLHAFSGFEAVTKEGVHFLCLFDPAKDGSLERFIGDCGVHDTADVSPTGSLDSEELLNHARGWESVCVAAHVAGPGGLLKTLSGQPRIKVWTSPLLLACSLPGPVEGAPQGLRAILKNEDASHRRLRPVAILNVQDVNDPEDLKKPGVSSWIKMSSVSVEGLRQAFLDPQSRIRLGSDPQPEPHAQFLAVAWEGGFLDGTALHFNESLNVLIGGRGSGKSTIIETLRYALGLEPTGEDAGKIHQGVVRNVLKSGTKISLLVRSAKPSPRTYTIERTIPNPPTVRDEHGQLVNVTPKDIIPTVELFGQHEISELTRSPERLTRLLQRFVDADPGLATRKSSLQLELERSRGRILQAQRELRSIDERLAALPALEETLKRFQAAGLEDRLKEKSLLVREERILATLAERMGSVRDQQRHLAESFPLDVAFLSKKALEGLPNAELLTTATQVLERLSTDGLRTAAQLLKALGDAEAAIAQIRSAWEVRRQSADATYQGLLRELQKTNVDGAEFIRLRRQIEELRPLRERRGLLIRDQNTYEAERRELLREWEDVKAQEYRAVAAAAQRVSRELRDRVRVEVHRAGNLEPLESLLRDMIGGNLSATFERLRSRPDLSLPEFSGLCREGKDALIRQMGLPPGAADRIAQGGSELCMRIEELELPDTTSIELNTAGEGQPANWQTLDDLSTGQKATAVLLLLLLESEAPLVVDQPEDDLDNRFITDGVVPIMKQEKRKRQFLFSTHNANIPVLADAELIVGLSASGEAQAGHARISREHMGSIDSRPVRELVEEILEGGKAAFETRRLKYGF